MSDRPTWVDLVTDTVLSPSHSYGINVNVTNLNRDTISPPSPTLSLLDADMPNFPFYNMPEP